jgi:hypothetical protein
LSTLSNSALTRHRSRLSAATLQSQPVGQSAAFIPSIFSKTELSWTASIMSARRADQLEVINRVRHCLALTL